MPLYSRDNGRSGKPIRMMCGLLFLKHLRDLSDESVVEQKRENTYYQYFCGMEEFTPGLLCASSEMVRFRHRIGTEGMKLIFQESIRVNNEKNDKRHHRTAFIDFTMQEKNITYLTDAKLHKKIVGKVQEIVDRPGLSQRQRYTFVLKRLYRDQRFRCSLLPQRIRRVHGRSRSEIGRTLDGKKDQDAGGRQGLQGKERGQRDKDYDTGRSPQIRQSVPAEEGTRAVLQAGGDRADHRAFEG